MIRKLLERTVGISLICALAVDLLLIGAVLIAQERLRSARTEYGRAEDSAAPPIAAFDLAGTPLDLADGNAGLAVWYGSPRCPYCRKDEEWRGLAAALHQKGVRVLVVLPSIADSFSNDDPLLRHAQQVAYINVEWLRRYPLSVTPTLLVFDRKQRLIWHRYGMLRSADVRAVLRIVDSTIKRD